MFVHSNTDRSRLVGVEYRPLPFSTPLSFRGSMLTQTTLSLTVPSIHTDCNTATKPLLFSVVTQLSETKTPAIDLTEEPQCLCRRLSFLAAYQLILPLKKNSSKAQFEIYFYILLTALRTVSYTYAQVARAQSCANHLQHIERLSHATGRITCHVVRRDSSAIII